MKQCPSCNRTYTDEALNFCLEDGSPLIADSPSASTSNATVRYEGPRDTNPPPTEIYNPNQQFAPAPAPAPTPPPVSQPVPFQPQWTPTPMLMAQPRRSNAIWWILGIFAVIVVLGIGSVVILIALASMSSSENNNNRPVANANTNRNTNARSSNANYSNSNTTNANTVKLPASFSDDFSEEKWSTGSSQFGDLWYANDQYHMKSKDKLYMVIYAPTDDYNTENANVKVTVHNVDGISPTTGYGLAVHGERKDGKLEDYSFLIYSGQNPQYKIVLHKGGEESLLVAWTPSNTIRSGTSPNQLEVRIKGANLSFYINGQFATSITDSANYKRGRVGFYTSDAHEVAFDNLQMTR
jgi:hypothetical protein